MCVCVCMCVCMCVWVRVCEHVCVYVCTYVYVCMHVLGAEVSLIERCPHFRSQNGQNPNVWDSTSCSD